MVPEYSTTFPEFAQCLVRSEYTDFGFFRLPDAAGKYHHVPNPHYKPFPLDLYLIDHFIGRDRCHRWPGQTAFPDQNHPNSRMPKF